MTTSPAQSGQCHRISTRQAHVGLRRERGEVCLGITEGLRDRTHPSRLVRQETAGNSPILILDGGENGFRGTQGKPSDRSSSNIDCREPKNNGLQTGDQGLQFLEHHGVDAVTDLRSIDFPFNQTRFLEDLEVL